MEIIVVERFSKDNSVEFFAQHPRREGCDRTARTGLVCWLPRRVPHAKYEHLFFCNEDMWFDPDFLAELEKQIDLSKRIAIFRPVQWTYDGADLDHGGVRFRRRAWEVNSPYPRRRQMPTVDLPLGTKSRRLCGAMLVHRDVYNELGGWDTKFFLDRKTSTCRFRVDAWNRVGRSRVPPGPCVKRRTDRSMSSWSRKNFVPSRRARCYTSRCTSIAPAQANGILVPSGRSTGRHLLRRG